MILEKIDFRIFGGDDTRGYYSNEGECFNIYVIGEGDEYAVCIEFNEELITCVSQTLTSSNKVVSSAFKLFVNITNAVKELNNILFFFMFNLYIN